MASSMTKLSTPLLLLLLLAATSTLPIEARESHFFSKTTRSNQTADETPSMLPNEEPTTLPSGTGSGYGLYGRGPDEYSPTTATTTANNNNNNYYYNARYDANNVNAEYGMSDTRFLENGRYFYDVNAEKHRSGYDPLAEDSGGYMTAEYGRNGARGGGGGGGYSYGTYRFGGNGNGNGNGYEYNNDAMHKGKYEQENQEEFAP